MHTSHDPVKSCTSLGHIYTSVTIVRCAHLEAWDVSVRCWSDNDQDDPIVHLEASKKFGPFDDANYRSAVVHELLTLAEWHQTRFPSL